MTGSIFLLRTLTFLAFPLAAYAAPAKRPCVADYAGLAYSWKYHKVVPDYGDDQIPFTRASDLPGLSSPLKELTTKPWGQIFQATDDASLHDRLPWNTLPALRLHTVDFDGITLYHQTNFSSVRPLVDLAADDAQGALKFRDVHFSNPQTEPAFYTHIDFGNAFIQDLPQQALLKLELGAKKNVTLLELAEPLSEEGKKRILKQISGQDDFWQKYQDQFKQNNEYDFDLFHSAVVAALRQFHHINVDLLLYLKDFEKEVMGRPSRAVYSWAIVHNRDILDGTKVSNVFYVPFSHELSRGTGVDERTYAAMSPAAIDMMTKWPQLSAAIDSALQPGRIQSNAELMAAAAKYPGGLQKFWQEFYPKQRGSFFSKEMTDELDRQISKAGFSVDLVKTIVHAKLLKNLQ